jgi:hypothetical protein
MADTKVAETSGTREADAWRPAAAAPAALPAAATGPRLTLAVRRVAARLPPRRRLADAFAEERAHGHFFLFVPVFLGAGAAAWFSAASEPPLFAVCLFLAAALWPAWRLRHREDWARPSSCRPACCLPRSKARALRPSSWTRR